jgi:catechol 2,3-dioxygenase-like lactoylglutathione lyase family enzyme
MLPQLAVVSLWVADLAAALRFYEQVIGLPLNAAPGKRPHFKLANGATLVLLEGRPQPAILDTEAFTGRFPTLVFAIPDFDSALQRLEQAGVRLPWGVETDQHRRWVMFHDPSGNLIELVDSNPHP